MWWSRKLDYNQFACRVGNIYDLCTTGSCFLILIWTAFTLRLSISDIYHASCWYSRMLVVVFWRIVTDLHWTGWCDCILDRIQICLTMHSSGSIRNFSPGLNNSVSIRDAHRTTLERFTGTHDLWHGYGLSSQEFAMFTIRPWAMLSSFGTKGVTSDTVTLMNGYLSGYLTSLTTPSIVAWQPRGTNG